MTSKEDFIIILSIILIDNGKLYFEAPIRKLCSLWYVSMTVPVNKKYEYQIDVGVCVIG